MAGKQTKMREEKKKEPLFLLLVFVVLPALNAARLF